MKIYLIGLPGSGKTTLAKSMADQYQLTHIELDQLFHQFDGLSRRRKYFEDVQNDLLSTLKCTNNWIAEGVYPVAEIYALADKVILLQVPLHICLFRQWKRYAIDPSQRDSARYGAFTNIGLSLMTIGLTLNIWGIKVRKHQPRVSYRQFFKKVGQDKVTQS